MIGELINGKYKIEAAFSESHMYEVFSAIEVATGAQVVLKILKEEMAVNSERVKCFSEEIKAFASLSHPLIAEVLDVDMFEDRPFVVAPFVRGEELHRLVKDTEIPFTDACRIVQDLATVLQYAADQKVECRTIKLSNVLRDKDGKLTVLAFTHPRLKLAGRSSRTENGGVHSDLFFLGSTFFELLAGESPIRKRGGINELWDMKLEKLLRIRHADLLPEQISRLVDFVKRTLTRDMNIRFNSHEEFLKALADLSGTIRSTAIKNKTRQLSMASQVVDALNGRMSNICTDFQPQLKNNSVKVAASAAAVAIMTAEPAGEPSDLSAGFAEGQIEGNLALASEKNDSAELTAAEKHGSAAKNRAVHLRLVKPASAEKTVASEAWDNPEEAHWLRNPVIFMGFCLVIMVALILFW